VSRPHLSFPPPKQSSPKQKNKTRRKIDGFVSGLRAALEPPFLFYNPGAHAAALEHFNVSGKH
jgi:hypothetical protein